MNDLKAVFSGFQSLQIMIIGDVMIDAYQWGKVNRISPEAPVPVVSVNRLENRLGGAANVALNVQAMGAVPTLCAIIGNDDSGVIFQHLLAEAILPAEGILLSETRKTTVKTRIISGTQHLLRIDDETTTPVSKALEEQFINHISDLLYSKSFDAVIFEDYDKGNITPNIIEKVVQITQKLKIPSLVDPKKRNFLEYKGVTLFKPNFKEICEGLKTDIPKSDILALHQAALVLKSKLNAGQIMVTLSERGVYISTPEGFKHIPAEIRDIADVSGAGDTVISVAACCLASGLDEEHIAVISNLAGGLVCEKAGVVPIDKNQLLAEVQRYFQY